MQIFIWALALMFFLLWGHRRLSNYYQISDKGKIDSLLGLAGVFLASYTFIWLIFHFQATPDYIAALEGSNSDSNAVADVSENHNGEDTTFSESFIELLPAEKLTTRFIDVAGLEEVKDEVQDIIKFLKFPKAFGRLGAKSPKGLLMYGPPGTGKTLLARAIAGESKVNFIGVSGSQFEEVYVGVGAKRVRQLFSLAREHAPCIIFIDEIDSLAFKRNSDKNAVWAEQTVNQLLTEMDGLDDSQNEGIVVFAATNRMESLDPAILRPGRFDRQVRLELPTINEREAILKLKLKKITTADDVIPRTLAKMTTGFSGAELANLVNEAAIDATKREKNAVDMDSFEIAKERRVMGAKRKAQVLSEKELRLTAYHEAGHALLGVLVPEYDPIYKVTIIPRGLSLGHTSFQPEDDIYSHNLRYLESNIITLMGGRVAEEIVFGSDQITTGAESDLQQATKIAYAMVTRWGFSQQLGPVHVNGAPQAFIPKAQIEKEVKTILTKSYQQAVDLLSSNRNKLDQLAKALLTQETLNATEVKKIVNQ